MDGAEVLSVIVPLYKSEENLPALFSEIERIAALCPVPLELVLVNDGSPDRGGALAEAAMPGLPVRTQLIHLSRNFGSFAAVAAGLEHARGDYFAVLAADLQEPPELVLQFLDQMRSGQADLMFGIRAKREDPLLSRTGSDLFWWLYRRLVNSDIPPGGVDVFGCNRAVRDRICSMKEVETSLIGLLFWIGFRRGFVPYERRARQHGSSAWTLKKKLRYLLNSIFNFTDLPIQILLGTGAVGVLLSMAGGATVLTFRLMGAIPIPGYTVIVLLLFFFGGLTVVGLGLVGQYVWLCLQNIRNRPAYIVRSKSETP